MKTALFGLVLSAMVPSVSMADSYRNHDRGHLDISIDVGHGGHGYRVPRIVHEHHTEYVERPYYERHSYYEDHGDYEDRHEYVDRHVAVERYDYVDHHPRYRSEHHYHHRD